jgi:hypothetical protein
MGDFGEKLLLALIAFLLGLLADVIKRVFQRERKRVEYAIETRPIIAANAPLPETVREKLPGTTPFSVTEFVITLENAGSVAVHDANALLSLGAGSDVLHYEITTEPAREVLVGAVEHLTSNELRLKGFTLEKKQKIMLDVFVRSAGDIQPEMYGSGGGGDVQWVGESQSHSLSLEGHVVASIKLFILAEVIESVVTGIVLLFSELFKGEDFSIRWQSPTFLVGSTVLKLVKLYFYLRIVPHALAIVREMGERLRRPPPSPSLGA